MHDLVSIIIPTRNEGNNLKKTIDSIRRNTDYPKYEFIVAYEDKRDCRSIKSYKGIKFVNTKGLGPSRARNEAAKLAEGKYVCFVDSHVFPKSREWLSTSTNFLDENKKTVCTPCILAHNNEKISGYGLTIKGPDISVEWLPKKQEKPYHVPIACACCMALKTKDFFDIGMFNQNFKKWGSEDTEFSLRAWLLGYSVYVLPNIEVRHLFKQKLSYSLSWKHIDTNNLLMIHTHFSIKRIKKIIKNMEKSRSIDEALKNVLEADIEKIREEMIKRRIYDDDWFFKKFNIKL